MTVETWMIWVGVIVAVLVVALWKRREVNAWAKTWRVKEASFDAKLLKGTLERTEAARAPGQPDAPATSAPGTRQAEPARHATPPMSLPPTPSPGEPTMSAPPTLHTQITKWFSLEEVRTLCFDFGVDYASLPGEGHAAKNRELVAHMERVGRLPELIAACAAQRPHVTWGTAATQPTPTSRRDAAIRIEQDASGGGAIRRSGISASKEDPADIRQDAHNKGTIEDSPINLS